MIRPLRHPQLRLLGCFLLACAVQHRLCSLSDRRDHKSLLHQLHEPASRQILADLEPDHLTQPEVVKPKPASTPPSKREQSSKASSSIDPQTNKMRVPPSNIKINYPVFVASLYKSGTTTIHSYFQCGHQKSVHYQNGRQRTGPCLKRRIVQRKFPVFEGCGGDHFDIYTDNAYLVSPSSCFDPSVHGLETIYESYPNATIVLAVRDTDAWVDSVERYKYPGWSLFHDLTHCPDLWPTQVQDVGNRTLTKSDLAWFYDWHTNHVRTFAQAHPSMTYIEVKLESSDAGRTLQDRIGISQECWGHRNVNTKHSKTRPMTKESAK